MTIRSCQIWWKGWKRRNCGNAESVEMRVSEIPKIHRWGRFNKCIFRWECFWEKNPVFREFREFGKSVGMFFARNHRRHMVENFLYRRNKKLYFLSFSVMSEKFPIFPVFFPVHFGIPASWILDSRKLGCHRIYIIYIIL